MIIPDGIGCEEIMIIVIKHRRFMIAGTLTRPSKPSVKLTEFADPTMTKVAKMA